MMIIHRFLVICKGGTFIATPVKHVASTSVFGHRDTNPHIRFGHGCDHETDYNPRVRNPFKRNGV